MDLSRKTNRIGEPRLSVETAETELRRLMDHYEIGIDDAADEEENLKTVKAGFEELLNAFRWGELETGDDEKNGFHVIQHLTGKDTRDILYRELKPADAKVLTRYDRRKEGTQMTMDLMGRLSGIGADAMWTLKGQDKITMAALAMIFMMA